MYSLVAVSGGSDSMSLLDKLRKSNKDLVVCHVNYKYRDSADRDEEIVRKYCEKYNIKLEILKGFKYDKKDGNFENWARVIRYNFFKEMYKKYNADYLYVGHNLDDLLETYFIQKERNSKCDYYGLKEEICIYEMKIKRILLSYTKQELNDYCLNNNIGYGIDETNFDENYLRNNIRHNVISKMSKEEKLKIVNEINELNKNKKKEYNDIHYVLEKIKKGNNIVDLSLFKGLDDKTKISIIYYFVIENVKVRISISDRRIKDIIKKIDSNKPNIMLGKFNDYSLYKEYESLVIKKDKNEFSYIIEDLSSDLGEFKICDTGKKLERIIVKKDMFPLKIENYKGDNKDINRLFIDKKVPVSERKMWPVVKDKLDNVLLVLNIEKFYNIKVSNKDDMIEFYIKRKEEEK